MPEAQSFHEEALVRRHASQDGLYLEFLRQPSLSAGLYVLPARHRDPQTPHTEDEVYVVLRGRGQIALDGQDHPVMPGSIVYVPARIEHRFHSIVEQLQVLVLFAPAEGTRSGAPVTDA
jgi:mannose-6-phosphate isomerase-like protein (cupin superfamily)